MKVEQHIELHGFRLTLICETNTKLGHKLVSESEDLQQSIKELLFTPGYGITELLRRNQAERGIENATA